MRTRVEEQTRELTALLRLLRDRAPEEYARVVALIRKRFLDGG
jgi:hypothetical protein